jgi:hypothetical protein
VSYPPIRATNWRGEFVDPSVLLKRYNLKFERAEERPEYQGNMDRYTHVGRVVALSERFGHAYYQVSVPGGASVNVKLPGDDRNHATNGGLFTLAIDTRYHTYEPRRGQHGPIGFAVAGMPSDYLSGVGSAFDQYENPGDLPRPDQGNNYGHLDVTFEILPRVGSVSPAPIPGPIERPGTVYEITAAELAQFRAVLSAGDDLLRAIVNRRPAR